MPIPGLFLASCLAPFGLARKTKLCPHSCQAVSNHQPEQGIFPYFKTPIWSLQRFISPFRSPRLRSTLGRWSRWAACTGIERSRGLLLGLWGWVLYSPADWISTLLTLYNIYIYTHLLPIGPMGEISFAGSMFPFLHASFRSGRFVVYNVYKCWKGSTARVKNTFIRLWQCRAVPVQAVRGVPVHRGVLCQDVLLHCW